MAETDLKADLRRYLQDAREAMLWKLDGMPEYDLPHRNAARQAAHGDGGHAQE